MTQTASSAALPTQADVAVIGAGAMGAGIAQVIAAAGHSVRLLDARPGAAAQAVAGLAAQFDKLAARGKLSPDAAAAAAQRLRAVDAVADLAGCALAVEAIVEDLAAKQTLLAQLEDVLGEGAILATNTSSISITAIGAALKRPQRLAGLHFFNPAPLMALVEVVSGLATDPAVADTLMASAAAWGKTPVRARSTPGFIVNRVARPFYAEALRVLGEGGADCVTLDALMREAGGFRMGPFELMDLIGHDVNFAVTRSVWQAFFNDPRFTPSLIQQELVQGGYLGRKTGRGFYTYDGSAAPAPATLGAQPLAAGITLHGLHPAAQALRARLSAAGVPFATDDDACDGCIARVDQAVLRACDGRSATEVAAATATPNTVLLDLALDYTRATRLGLAAAASCAPEALNAVGGVLQAAGYAVSVLADVPGLIVTRTVAMLANEAADAVNQGVADAAGVDTAMRLGVNYPQGPLAWADAWGIPHVAAVLRHLAATYGEDRYRTSPLIQRHLHAQTRFHA
ncbi:MAG: 3-hydroxyacyl-CoA dehydrogenase [Rhodoferax sp.]